MAWMYKSENRSYDQSLRLAAILGQFWHLVASLKALVHLMLLYMDSGTIGRCYGYQNGQQSWLTVIEIENEPVR